jgi:thioredoxin reductase
LAIEVKKVNYVHSFTIKDNKVEKLEEKLVIISTGNEEKLIDFLSNNFSQFERISIK